MVKRKKRQEKSVSLWYQVLKDFCAACEVQAAYVEVSISHISQTVNV